MFMNDVFGVVSCFPTLFWENFFLMCQLYFSTFNFIYTSSIKIADVRTEKIPCRG